MWPWPQRVGCWTGSSSSSSRCQSLSNPVPYLTDRKHERPSKTWESDRQSRTEIQKNLVTSAMTFAWGCLTTEWVCCLLSANSPFCARYTTVLSSDSCPRGASKTPSLDKVESLSRQAAPWCLWKHTFFWKTKSNELHDKSSWTVYWR